MDNEKKTTPNEPSRQRRKPNQRTSNAARAAQRRREERQERAHLETLREKQSRKAKKRNKPRKRISRTAIKRILIMLAILLALILSMIIFFRVRNIEVQTVKQGIDVLGNGYYTAEEIIAASGLEEGDNLLILSRAEIAGNIMAECHYVSGVQVLRSLPDTVQIIIEEYDATYAVRDSEGEHYLITAGGKVTEKITAATAGQYIRIKGLTINPPAVGQIATVMAPSGQETAAKGQFDALTLLLRQLEEQELLKVISSVSVPSSYEISLQYTDRFTVKLGDTSELTYKINYLKKVVDEQKPYATGTIDLTQAAEGKVSVMLDTQ